MRIKIKKAFKHQATPRKVETIEPGIYEVGVQIELSLAELAVRFCKAEFLKDVKKVAPENKVVKAPENKTNVAKLPVRGSRSRPKPNK